jgi:hypothetical protein
MAYALLITNEEGFPIIKHVANEADAGIYFEDAGIYGAQSEWRKASHLIDWVKVNQPHWKVETKTFSVLKLF